MVPPSCPIHASERRASSVQVEAEALSPQQDGGSASRAEAATHISQPGETLALIAIANGVEVDALVEWNRGYYAFFQELYPDFDGKDLDVHLAADSLLPPGHVIFLADPGDTSGLSDVLRKIHTDGYALVPAEHLLTPDLGTEVQQTRCRDLLFDVDGDDMYTGSKRKQGKLKKGGQAHTAFTRLAKENGVMDAGHRCVQGGAVVSATKDLEDVYKLRSEKERDPTRMQPRHADSRPRDSLPALPSAKLYELRAVPLAMMIAAPNGFRLHVYPRGKSEPIEIEVSAGEALIFRGDLGHAGAAYTELRERIHAYLNSKKYPIQYDEKDEQLTYKF